MEAVSEEIRVSSELTGRLKTVNVEEGDRVQRGRMLAEIENADYHARVAAREADLSQREARGSARLPREELHSSASERRDPKEASPHGRECIHTI